MSEEENTNNSGFMLGVVLGGIIGAAATYFLAGEGNEEVKKKILKKGKVLLRNLSDFGEDVVDKGEEIKDMVTDKVEEVTSDIQETVHEVKKEAKKDSAKFQKTVEKAKEKVGEKAVEAVEATADKAHETEKSLNKAERGIKRFFFKKGSSLAKK